MEFLTSIFSIIILLVLFMSPILVLNFLNKRNLNFKFLVYLILGVISTMALTCVFAWWVDTSNFMLLAHYGYNIDGMGEGETYGNVLPENMERVRSLRRSVMGIGWPLKAVFAFVTFSLYLIIVYVLYFVVKRYRANNKH